MTRMLGRAPRGIWSVLLAGVLAGMVVGACGLLQPGLLQTLPVEAAGVEFDLVLVVDDVFLSGHAVDDVLARLGKERAQATAVFRNATTGGGGVGAVTVDGVSGAELLDAVVQTWRSEATVSRRQMTIGDREVWALETRTGHLTYAYQRGAVVYLAYGDDPALVERLVREGLP